MSAVRHWFAWVFGGCLLLLAAIPAHAALSPQNVLVVVNTNSTDSVAIGSFYTNLHPGASIVQIATTTSPSLLRSNFFSEIRDPIRSYLNSTAGLATQIVSIVTTRGVPHQITDPAGQGGDSVFMFQGTGTYSSVDSELTLLWQDMVAGPTFTNSSPANGAILNPYYAAFSPIDAFSRNSIQTAKNWSGVVISNGFLVFESPSSPFTGNNAFGFFTKGSEPVANQLTPGDLYLVTRLSGYSVTEVTNSIVRSQNIQVNKSTDVIVLDKDASNFDGGIYNNASNILGTAGFTIRFDSTSVFVSNVPPGELVLSYSSYGNNSAFNPGPQYINNYLQFSYANGAIFNTYESFNGQEFNNPAHGTQGMVADFIKQGGSLGFGHVFEPFSFAVANEDIYLTDLLLSGRTWAEAAYDSIFQLSWQNLVLGDPLATFSIIPEPSALAWLGMGLVLLIFRRRRA